MIFIRHAVRLLLEFWLGVLRRMFGANSLIGIAL